MNGLPVRTAEIVVPAQGIWWADLVLTSDAVAATSGPAVLELASGQSLRGTVRRGRVYEGGVEARIIGGAGGLGNAIPARHYRRPSARLVASDVCAETGETLASSSALDPELASWSRIVGTGGNAIALLGEKLGVSWRMSLAGEVVFGNPTWADSKLTALQVYNRDPANAMAELASFVEPGLTVLGERVTRSTISVAENGSVTFRAHFGEVAVPSGASALDRLKGSIMAFVRGAIANVDYHAHYSCTVVLQAADDTLELKPDNPKVAPIAGVPIKLGLPGASVKVPKGARVLLSWNDGDPSQPRADLWDMGTGMTELRFDGGGQSVSRVGDVVSCTIPPGTTFNGVAGPPVNAFVGTFILPVPITGTILTGAPRVKA